MKKSIFFATVLLSFAAYAQNSEQPKIDLNKKLAEPKLELLKNPTFVAKSVVLLDENGHETDTITTELLVDLQQAGKVPTIRIGSMVFELRAPVDPRQYYPGPQE